MNEPPGKLQMIKSLAYLPAAMSIIENSLNNGLKSEYNLDISNRYFRGMTHIPNKYNKWEIMLVNSHELDPVFTSKVPYNLLIRYEHTYTMLKNQVVKKGFITKTIFYLYVLLDQYAYFSPDELPRFSFIVDPFIHYNITYFDLTNPATKTKSITRFNGIVMPSMICQEHKEIIDHQYWYKDMASWKHDSYFYPTNMHENIFTEVIFSDPLCEQHRLQKRELEITGYHLYETLFNFHKFGKINNEMPFIDKYKDKILRHINDRFIPTRYRFLEDHAKGLFDKNKQASPQEKGYNGQRLRKIYSKHDISQALGSVYLDLALIK